MDSKVSNKDLEKSYLYFRKEYKAQDLVDAHPLGKPNFPLKAIVYNAANKIDSGNSKGRPHNYNVIVSRYKALPLGDQKIPSLSNPKSTKFLVREDVYDYQPISPGAVEWHVNFADTHLFVAYSAPLFAQDEIQAAEIPILGHIKQQLSVESKRDLQHPQIPLTRLANQATPILIHKAERRCEVSLGPDANAGRPRGLYGNNFAYARPEAVLSAVKVLDPPQVVSIIAMAALSGGYGNYSIRDITDTYQTAYTSFRAAVAESGEGAEVVVHTGNWGTGAFGGNREFMAAVQLVAAQHAGVHVLVYHSFNKIGTEGFRAGMKTTEKMLKEDRDVFDVLVEWGEQNYKWGVSDGN